MDIMRDLADAFGIRLQEVPIPPEAARLMNDVLANTTPSQWVTIRGHGPSQTR